MNGHGGAPNLMPDAPTVESVPGPPMITDQGVRPSWRSAVLPARRSPRLARCSSARSMRRGRPRRSGAGVRPSRSASAVRQPVADIARGVTPRRSATSSTPRSLCLLAALTVPSIEFLVVVTNPFAAPLQRYIGFSWRTSLVPSRRHRTTCRGRPCASFASAVALWSGFWPRLAVCPRWARLSL